MLMLNAIKNANILINMVCWRFLLIALRLVMNVVFPTA